MPDDGAQGVEEQGGDLLARISNEFVTMQKEFWGLGPLEAKSYMMDDLLLVVMRGGMTRAELTMIDFDEHAGWLRTRRGPYTLLANFSQRDVHVPLEETVETVLTTHHATLEPGFVVLPALSGALLR